jgi:inner membrane protein
MTRLISDRTRNISVSVKAVAIAGIVGAIAPDFDMAYFYLIDDGKTHHHKYVSHWPLLWLSMAFVSFLFLRLTTNKRRAFLATVFSLGGVLHILLDSVVGDVWWFAPVVDKPYSLFTVTARYDPWWLNFFLHWSFALEVAITAWAVIVFRKQKKSRV